MSAPRRRIIRPASNGQAASQKRQQQLDRLRAALARERAALARWQKRLRRAFNAIQKTERLCPRRVGGSIVGQRTTDPGLRQSWRGRFLLRQPWRSLDMMSNFAPERVHVSNMDMMSMFPLLESLCRSWT